MSNPTERFESQLADLLIDKIKQLQTDWKKPWFETTATIKNIQGRPYAGSNSMLLRLVCDALKWDYPVFTTFKMAKEQNVSILKGSASVPIIFHKESYKHKDRNVYITPKEYEDLSQQDKQDYTKKVLTTYANVFNIAQTNIQEVRPDLFEEVTKEYRETARDLTNSEENRIDELVRNQAWFCPIKTDLETGAHYNLKTNEIHITPKSRFLSDGLFHSTLLHEMTHSTGHSDLLDRLTPTIFGSPEYGREELVAELGSALTGAHYDLPVSLLEDHASYLKAWLKTLKEEPEFLHTVLGDASKASRLTIQRIDSQEQYITTEETKVETKPTGLEITSEIVGEGIDIDRVSLSPVEDSEWHYDVLLDREPTGLYLYYDPSAGITDNPYSIGRTGLNFSHPNSNELDEYLSELSLRPEIKQLAFYDSEGGLMSKTLTDFAQVENVILKEHPEFYEAIGAEREANIVAELLSTHQINMEQSQEKEKINVNKEVLPYAELYAHEENMTTAYITEKGLNLPDEVRSEIHARDSVLLGLEMNNMPELEPEMLRRKFELEDSIREKLGDYLSSEYGFSIAPYLSHADKESALNSIQNAIVEKKSNERLIQDGLNDRLDIEVERDDTPVERAVLDATDTDYDVTPGGRLKTKGVARIKEGYALTDTQENRNFLEKNDITYKPIKGDRLFVSRSSKKAALLLAASVGLTPVVGIAVMYVLNRSHILDRVFKEESFTKEEAAKLNNGQTIKKTSHSNGRPIDKFFFVDRDTHHLRSIPVHEVHLPNRVNGVELSAIELDDLRNGKTVTGYDEKSDQYYEARMDLNNKRTIQVGFKEMKSDKQYESVPTPNSPDSVKVAYIEKHGAQGVNDIWDRGGVNLERDSFLDRYDVGKFYRGYISASQQNNHDTADWYSQSLKDAFSATQEKSIHR